MKAGMRSLVTNTPLMNPQIVATAMVISIAAGLPIRVTMDAPRTPARADMDPMEMSKSPLMMQNTIPIEPIPTREEKERLLTRLYALRNGEESRENTRRRTRTRNGRPKLSHRFAAHTSAEPFFIP